MPPTTVLSGGDGEGGDDEGGGDGEAGGDSLARGGGEGDASLAAVAARTPTVMPTTAATIKIRTVHAIQAVRRPLFFLSSTGMPA